MHSVWFNLSECLEMRVVWYYLSWKIIYGNSDRLNSKVCLQVRRLQHHPSVALWAGNNENEIALIGNWYDTDKNFSVYKEDYLKLYVHTIMDVVNKEDPERPYIVSLGDKFKNRI